MSKLFFVFGKSFSYPFFTPRSYSVQRAVPSFEGTIYDVPPNQEALDRQLEQLNAEINDQR